MIESLKMKAVYLYILNIFLVLSIWILCAFFSPSIAKVLVFITFILLIIKNLYKHFFLLYYMFLFLSDSRLDLLYFVQEIKSFIAIIFYGFCFFFYLKKKNYINTFNVKHWGLFIFFILISLIINDFDFVIFQKSISYILLFVLSVPLIQDFIKGEKHIIKALVYILISVLLLGFIFHFVNNEITILNGRYRGLFGNPNGLGIFIVLTFFIFQILKMKFVNLFSKREAIIISIVILFNLILCQSRSCILSVLIFYFFNFILNYSTVLAVMTSLIIVILYGFVSVNILDLIKTLNLENYVRLNTLENASGRYIAWTFLWQKIDFQTFFFGNGLGSTEILFKKNYSILSQLGHEGNAHNSFLTLWYDIGFLGMISFLFFIVMSFVKSNKFLNLIPILIGLLLSAFFESWMSASLNPFTILFLVVITIIGSDYYKISTNE